MKHFDLFSIGCLKNSFLLRSKLRQAGVVKLVDTLDLGSSAVRRGGSSPFSRTIIKCIFFIFLFLNFTYSQSINQADVKAALNTIQFPTLSGKFTLNHTTKLGREKIMGTYYQSVIDENRIKMFVIKNPSRLKGKAVKVSTDKEGKIIAKYSEGVKMRKKKSQLLGSAILYQDLERLNPDDFNIDIIEYLKQGFQQVWKAEFYPKNEDLMYKYGFSKAMVFLNSKSLLPERIGFRPLNKSYYKMVTVKSYADIKGVKVPKVIQVTLRNKNRRLSQSILSFQGLKRKKKIKAKYLKL